MECLAESYRDFEEHGKDMSPEEWLPGAIRRLSSVSWDEAEEAAREILAGVGSFYSPAEEAEGNPVLAEDEQESFRKLMKRVQLDAEIVVDDLADALEKAEELKNE